MSHSHTINSGGAHGHDLRQSTLGEGGVQRDIKSFTGTNYDTTAIMPVGDHTHPAGNQSASHSHGITVNNEGVSGVNANRPAFYDVIMIIRMS